MQKLTDTLRTGFASTAVSTGGKGISDLIIPETQPQAHAVGMAGSMPAASIEVAPDPGCKTICRRDAAVEPTGRYLRRVLQPGAGYAAVLCLG